MKTFTTPVFINHLFMNKQELIRHDIKVHLPHLSVRQGNAFH